MTTAELIAKVRVEGQFDSQGASTGDSAVLGWLNARHRELAARSRWFKGSVEFGPTIAGTATYAFPGNVIEILALQVGGGGEAHRTNVEGVWSLRAGSASLPAGRAVAYAPAFGTSAETAQLVELWPTPSVSGVAVTALVVLAPVALAVGVDPVWPVDVHEALVDGAIATGLRRTDGRADLAVPFEEKFEAAVGELKRRAVSRVGQGPVQFAIRGRHF